MDDIKKKLIDWAEAWLGPIVFIAYFRQIAGVLAHGRDLATKSVQRAGVWLRYNLPTYVRPLYGFAAMLTAVTWAIGSIIAMLMTPKDAGTWPYWLWTIFDAVLLVVLLSGRHRLGTVHPMTDRNIEKLEEIATRTAEQRRRNAVRRAGAPTPAQLENIERNAERAGNNRAKRVRESKYGSGDVMTTGMFAFALLAPFINGVGLWAMASLSNHAGCNWLMTAQFVFAGLIMGYVSLFMIAFLAASLGSTVLTVSELLISLFKGGWDSIITFLPNIEGEEAKELLPKNLGKHVSSAWKVFTNVVLSAPGIMILAVLSLAINWHHPLEIIFLSLAFLGLAKSTLVSRSLGNDVTPSQKRAGKIIATFFWTGFLYRVAEGWWFGWGVSGTWYWMPKMFSNPLRMGWNMFVPWWNGLTHMNWWQALLSALVLIIILAQIAKMPSGKWTSYGKYALMAFVGLGLLIVAVGFIANRASVDTSASTVALIPTVVHVPADARGTGETVAETAHAPDAIDEMTGAATPPTPPPVVAAPPVVAPVVTAEAHASTTTRRPTVEHPECVGLTPRYHARMQDRGLCP